MEKGLLARARALWPSRASSACLITILPHPPPLPCFLHSASNHKENRISKLGIGELFPRGVLVSLCPRLPPLTGFRVKGALRAGGEDYCHHL